MVGALHPNVVAFLKCLHDAPRAGGIEELSRLPGWPTPRSIYRWQHVLGDRLIYFPTVSYGALGLVHVHLFLEQPREHWDEFPYAIRARWVVRRAGVRILYLYCLIPTEHITDVRCLVEQVHQGICRFVVSEDGWQALGDLSALTTPNEELPQTSAVDARGLVERYPLLVPIVLAAAERRQSLDDLWQDLRLHLGEQVWAYLPRGARRTPHNGKQYVREGLRVLNDAFLFRQNVIRYQPLQDATIELVLLVRAERLSDVLSCLADAPLVEVYPAAEGLLLHVTCGLQSLSAIFSADTRLAVTDLFVVDRTRNQSAPVSTRFAYELLFDPRTCQWRFPREEILRRLSR